MRAARSVGVPRSVFLGRIVGAGEPLWLDEDRSYLLALQAYEDSLCDGCGLPLPETTATHRGQHIHRYKVDEPSVCAGCAALARDMNDQDPEATLPGSKFRLVEV